MNLFESLDANDKQILEEYLRPIRFPKGSCLVREGDPGDGCYFIDSGEIRLELRRMDTDSEGVLGYLEKGALLGEFGLLDGQPRSASAFAQTDAELRWLSRADFEALCLKYPAMGIRILNALGCELTAKLRRQNRQVAEHLFSDEVDAETKNMVARSVAAQKGFADWDEPRVDALLLDLAESVAAQAEALAEANVADSGIGVVQDKVAKIRFACMEVFKTLVGKKAAGPIAEDRETLVQSIATPVGVVLGIIPVTNPVSTIVFKTQICLKGRNALIFSCHRDALRVGSMTGDLIAAALKRHHAPDDLVQWIRSRTDRKKTSMLMRHPDVSFILATGGPSIVKAAYSSGTPAIGVGAGNAPVLICADADIPAAAKCVIQGKSFDNGVICGSENNLVVVKKIRDEFVRQLEAHGAVVLTPDAKNQLAAQLFDEEGHLARQMVGKSAVHIAKACGISCLSSTRLLVVPVGLDEVSGPYGHEKLAPVLSLFTVADEEEGLSLCTRILKQQGLGHTAAIHTGDDRMARRYGMETPASRIIVNTSSSTGCIGIGTGLTPSFTLGCGTNGGNSTTDNVTYTHVLNVKRLALDR